MRVDRSVAGLVLCGLSLSPLLLPVESRAQYMPPKVAVRGAAPKRADEQYKNIQVLKNIPADQIMPSMQFINAALGVDCGFCHVGGAMEKDDKKAKATARKMISMMMVINKYNFEGNREVTCYSCHRGSTDPISTPVLTDDEPRHEAAAGNTPGDEKAVLPAADQLLDKYLAALGGAAALQKITSRVQKGTLAGLAGRSVPIEIYALNPGKRVSVLHYQEAESITAFDGKQGWLQVRDHVQMMSPAENDSARIDADLHLAEHLGTLYHKFQVETGAKIDGHDTYLVVASNEEPPPLRLYFDQQSGLLLRLIRYVETPLGRIPTQIDYADYRDADGVKVPFRWTLARPGNRFTIQVDELKQNVPVDDNKFVLPASAAKQEPASP